MGCRKARKEKTTSEVSDRGRGYAIGERNPDTLPGHTGEDPHKDFTASRHWRSRRRKAQSTTALIGMKYYH